MYGYFCNRIQSVQISCIIYIFLFFAGEYEWIWSIFFNTCYVCMAAGGIWFYLASKRNYIQDNLPKKAVNIPSPFLKETKFFLRKMNRKF